MDEVGQLQAAADYVLRLYFKLANQADQTGCHLWPITPKFHWFWHFAHRSSFWNPRANGCMIDDYFGVRHDGSGCSISVRSHRGACGDEGGGELLVDPRLQTRGRAAVAQQLPEPCGQEGEPGLRCLWGVAAVPVTIRRPWRIYREDVFDSILDQPTASLVQRLAVLQAAGTYAAFRLQPR